MATKKKSGPPKGRFTAFTDEKKAAFLNYLRMGVPRTKACWAAGFSDDTMYRHLESDADFADATKESEAYVIAIAAGSIMEAYTSKELSVKEKQWTAAAWMLERRHPAEFGRRIEAKVESSGTTQVEHIIRQWTPKEEAQAHQIRYTHDPVYRREVDAASGINVIDAVPEPVELELIEAPQPESNGHSGPRQMIPEI